MSWKRRDLGPLDFWRLIPKALAYFRCPTKCARCTLTLTRPLELIAKWHAIRSSSSRLLPLSSSSTLSSQSSSATFLASWPDQHELLVRSDQERQRMLCQIEFIPIRDPGDWIWIEIYTHSHYKSTDGCCHYHCSNVPVGFHRMAIGSHAVLTLVSFVATVCNFSVFLRWKRQRQSTRWYSNNCVFVIVIFCSDSEIVMHSFFLLLISPIKWIHLFQAPYGYRFYSKPEKFCVVFYHFIPSIPKRISPRTSLVAKSNNLEIKKGECRKLGKILTVQSF